MHIWPFEDSVYVGDHECNEKLNYICQPKSEKVISTRVFQLDDASILEFTLGGCFSAAVKVQSIT